jgi:hypothetical protein
MSYKRPTAFLVGTGNDFTIFRNCIVKSRNGMQPLTSVERTREIPYAIMGQVRAYE